MFSGFFSPLGRNNNNNNGDDNANNANNEAISPESEITMDSASPQNPSNLFGSNLSSPISDDDTLTVDASIVSSSASRASDSTGVLSYDSVAQALRQHGMFPDEAPPQEGLNEANRKTRASTNKNGTEFRPGTPIREPPCYDGPGFTPPSPENSTDSTPTRLFKQDAKAAEKNTLLQQTTKKAQLEGHWEREGEGNGAYKTPAAGKKTISQGGTTAVKTIPNNHGEVPEPSIHNFGDGFRVPGVGEVWVSILGHVGEGKEDYAHLHQEAFDLVNNQENLPKDHKNGVIKNVWTTELTKQVGKFISQKLEKRKTPFDENKFWTARIPTLLVRVKNGDNSSINYYYYVQHGYEGNVKLLTLASDEQHVAVRNKNDTAGVGYKVLYPLERYVDLVWKNIVSGNYLAVKSKSESTNEKKDRRLLALVRLSSLAVNRPLLLQPVIRALLKMCEEAGVAATKPHSPTTKPRLTLTQQPSIKKKSRSTMEKPPPAKGNEGATKHVDEDPPIDGDALRNEWKANESRHQEIQQARDKCDHQSNEESTLLLGEIFKNDAGTAELFKTQMSILHQYKHQAEERADERKQQHEQQMAMAMEREREREERKALAKERMAMASHQAEERKERAREVEAMARERAREAEERERERERERDERMAMASQHHEQQMAMMEALQATAGTALLIRGKGMKPKDAAQLGRSVDAEMAAEAEAEDAPDLDSYDLEKNTVTVEIIRSERLFKTQEHLLGVKGTLQRAMPVFARILFNGKTYKIHKDCLRVDNVSQK